VKYVDKNDKTKNRKDGRYLGPPVNAVKGWKYNGVSASHHAGRPSPERRCSTRLDPVGRGRRGARWNGYPDEDSADAQKEAFSRIRKVHVPEPGATTTLLAGVPSAAGTRPSYS